MNLCPVPDRQARVLIPSELHRWQSRGSYFNKHWVLSCYFSKPGEATSAVPPGSWFPKLLRSVYPLLDTQIPWPASRRYLRGCDRQV
jgi:hypothetical protein